MAIRRPGFSASRGPAPGSPRPPTRVRPCSSSSTPTWCSRPDALARTVALLRQARLDFVSPYPRQLAGSVAERLVQPLLTWSWLTLLPLRLAERSRRPSLAIANGQLLAVDAARYRASGGHAAPGVRSSVLEDIALARALRAHGGSGGMADGTDLATCRMYDGWPQLRDGYAKSLWAAAGGSRLASAASDRAARLAVPASRSGLPTWPASSAGSSPPGAPASAHCPTPWPTRCRSRLLGALTAHSWRLRLRGALAWKGRPVTRRRRGRGVGTRMARIVVIGAGLGGLAAAARLTRPRPRRHRLRAFAAASAASSARTAATATASTPDRRC